MRRRAASRALFEAPSTEAHHPHRTAPHGGGAGGQRDPTVPPLAAWPPPPHTANCVGGRLLGVGAVLCLNVRKTRAAARPARVRAAAGPRRATPEVHSTSTTDSTASAKKPTRRRPLPPAAPAGVRKQQQQARKPTTKARIPRQRSREPKNYGGGSRPRAWILCAAARVCAWRGLQNASAQADHLPAKPFLRITTPTPRPRA